MATGKDYSVIIGKVVEGKCKGDNVFLCPPLDEKMPGVVVGTFDELVFKSAEGLALGTVKKEGFLGLKMTKEFSYYKTFEEIKEVKEVKHIRQIVYLQITFDDSEMCVIEIPELFNIGTDSESNYINLYNYLFEKLGMKFVE